jgi:A/G-specific adenine glycosylase
MLNFPDITSLANADEDKVLSLWSGLGYYARARNLQKSANIISDLFGGIFPTKFDDLLSLPGIGKSTAGAIMALAYHQSYAIMDGNVKRVLSRVYAVAGWSGQAEIAKQLWQLAEHHTPEENVANYTQAMMDLGATLCTRSRPGCLKCPVADDCLAFQQGETTKYPMSKPKVKKQVRTFRFLIMAEQNENHLILLEKRPPTGIWGGLWSFPECLVDDDIDCYCKEKHHVEVLLKKELPMMVHQLTHFTFNIIPVYLKVNRLLTHVSDPSAEWVNIVDISSLGISKPVEKLIRLIYFGNSQ